MSHFVNKPHKMSRPCKCGSTDGMLTTVGVQDRVDCAACGQYVYFAPKTETGREVRTTKTVHAAITGPKRYRVLARANHQCELCNAVGKPLHVGHLLSVDEGVRQGLNDQQINSEENLAAMCDECNLGMKAEAMPLWLILAILKARCRNVSMISDPTEAA